MSRTSYEVDAIGQWAVIDWFNGRTTLLAVGKAELGGVSLRNRLDARSRIILGECLQRTIHQGSGADEIVRHCSQDYRVLAQPIVTPDGETVIGAYGVFEKAGAPLPGRPLIGTWEWVVERFSGRVLDSRWNADLYAIHEMDADNPLAAGDPAAFWMSSLIPEADRARLTPVVNEGVRIANGRRHLIAVDGIAGLGTTAPTRKHLMISANCLPLPSDPDLVGVTRGFTRVVAESNDNTLGDVDAVGARALLDAMAAITRCSAIVAIDTVQGTVFMRSAGWDEAGLPPGFIGEILGLAAPGSKRCLEAVIYSAADRDEAGTQAQVKLLCADGQYRGFLTAAVAVDRPPAPARYVMASFTPQSEN